MRYHSNHCWCSNSCWNNETIDGEVIVVIDKGLNTYSIDKYANEIKDPDWENLIEFKEVFSQIKYDEHLEMFKRFSEISEENKNKFFDENGELKKEIKESAISVGTKQVPMIKQELLDWLNENIADQKSFDEDDEEIYSKGWAVYSLETLVNESKNDFNIFFARQIDALKFIHEFSIFKEPTIYFDYFKDECSELSTDKVIDILNDLNYDIKIENLKLNDTSKINGFIKDLSPYDYKLMDWDIDDDDIDLTKEQVKILIDNIYQNNNSDDLELK